MYTTASFWGRFNGNITITIHEHDTFVLCMNMFYFTTEYKKIPEAFLNVRVKDKSATPSIVHRIQSYMGYILK